MKPFVSDPDFTLYVGDALEVLAGLPDESVHCCVTSPPYWGLRDYGTGAWAGGDPTCEHRVRENPRNEKSGLQGGKTTNGHAAEGFKDSCPRCGATRTDRQLGLEPTPDEYVAAIVAVFREVRRVLRGDGTLFLNLGDTYASAWPCSRRNVIGEGSLENGKRENRPPRMPDGLKEKDLVGIPWRVAFALQQPYYTGRIKSEADRLWLAAMVDTEGCIHIHKRSAGAKSHTHTLVSGEQVEYERKTDTYGVMVSIDNTSEALIDRIHAIVGQGSRYTHEKGVGQSNRKRTLYRITLTGQQSRELLRELYPHLIAKQHEARIAYHSPSSGAGAEAAWLAVKALHNGEDTTVDYPEPPTLYEPGWYLRSDVIWGKPNPMPESVTDRPTKAHEYVFLLSRSPRYFFDAEAVREPMALASEGRYAYAFGGAKAEALKEANEDGIGVRTRTIGMREPTVGRNVRSVWEIATQPYAEAHFATFPEALVERCVLAGTSERGCCPACGAPWVRVVERDPNPTKDASGPNMVPIGARGEMDTRYRSHGATLASPPPLTTGWRPTCDCLCPTCTVGLSHDSRMSGVRRDVRAEVGQQPLAETEVLQPDVLEPTRRTKAPAAHEDDEGLHRPAHAGASGSVEAGLHHGAPRDHGARAGTPADAGRSGASPERAQGRQPAGEPGSDAATTARSEAEASAAAGAVSALRGDGLDPQPLEPRCRACGSALATRPAVVLDCFGGSGTSALVARRLGRRSILIELNQAYAELAARRLQQLSLLAEGD